MGATVGVMGGVDEEDVERVHPHERLARVWEMRWRFGGLCIGQGLLATAVMRGWCMVEDCL